MPSLEARVNNALLSTSNFTPVVEMFQSRCPAVSVGS